MRALFCLMLCSPLALAQATPATPPASDQNPPVKVNVLNVCTPSSEEQKELRAALARVARDPSFATDYEISRGVTTLDDGTSAKYVRLRRDFKAESPLVTAQYSLSADAQSTVETLVIRGRDARDLLALSIEDKLSTAVSKPAKVVETDTPASRVRLERAAKNTVALARCENVDQGQYELLFAQASSVLSTYRKQLHLRTMLGPDLSWLNNTGAASPSATHSPQPH